MMLQTNSGSITINSSSILISCKNKDRHNVWQELFKLVPKETKIKDIKKIITDKISVMMK